MPAETPPAASAASATAAAPDSRELRKGDVVRMVKGSKPYDGDMVIHSVDRSVGHTPFYWLHIPGAKEASIGTIASRLVKQQKKRRERPPPLVETAVAGIQQ